MGVWVKLAAASDIIKASADQACANGVCGNASLMGIFNRVANALIFLIGAVSVVMIIIGGIKYVTSNGDAKAVGSAKDTILYSVIGIIVAIASYAVVTFVTTVFK